MLPKNVRIRSRNLQILKKKRTLHAKKQAGAELKKKEKDFFGSKTGEKFGNKVQKLNNLKEKKDFSGQKEKAGSKLKNKFPQLGKYLRIMSRN